MAQQNVMIDGLFPPGSALPVAQAAPAAASAPLVANSLAGSVTTAGTIITIPANRIWYGWFGLSSTLVGTVKTASVTVQTTGGTAVPASSVDLLSLALATGATTDATKGGHISDPIYVYAGASGCDITVTVTGDPAILSATACGYLLS